MFFNSLTSHTARENVRKAVSEAASLHNIKMQNKNIKCGKESELESYIGDFYPPSGWSKKYNKDFCKKCSKELDSILKKVIDKFIGA